MRCPKCGTISFDWVRQCEKCGKDLGELASVLGLDAEVSEEVDWFSMPDQPDQVDGAQPGDAPSPPDLSAIDVSDLVAPPTGKAAGETDPEIDADEVARIAGDEMLSRTLDRVIQQEA
jgi:hypothetical protein